MNKAELIKTAAGISNQTQNEVKFTLEAIIEAITTELTKGGKVQLVGFGSFEVRRKAARVCRNPQTGEEMQIPAKLVPVFKPGKELKDAIKG